MLHLAWWYEGTEDEEKNENVKSAGPLNMQNQYLVPRMPSSWFPRFSGTDSNTTHPLPE